MKNLAIFSIVYFILLAAALAFCAHDLLFAPYSLSLNLLFVQYEFNVQMGHLIIFPLGIYVLAVLASLYMITLRSRILASRRKKDLAAAEQICTQLVLLAGSTGGFKSPEFRALMPLLEQVCANKAAIDGGELAAAIAARAQILRGEYCDVKLPKNSPLEAINQANLCASDLDAAQKALRGKTAINTAAQERAYENLLQNGSYESIKRLQITRQSAENMQLLRRLADGNLALSAAEIQVLLSTSGFSSEEFVQAAKTLLKCTDASVLLAIFSAIAAEREAAIRAHWLLLAELGMWDDLRSAVHAQEGKNEDFELLLFLKDSGRCYEPSKLIY